MKKMILLGALMLSAAAGYSQESRQDISISGFDLLGPTVHGNTDVVLRPSTSAGVLASYRYLLTPRSGLEVNYGFAQNTDYYVYEGFPTENPVHARQQEMSTAYVFGLSFKRYNPFIQAGVGALIFTPIQQGTYSLGTKQQTNIGGLFGGGVAYELSPSFDLRVEYRGFVVKAPSFTGDFATNRYEVVSMPAIGFAYHF
jgi:opacity protein-like surface antigen